MAVIHQSRSDIRLPWLDLQSNCSDNNVQPFHFKNMNIVQHSPHPSRIRHIKTFDGSQICVVDTEEIFSRRIPSVLFPPNQYADNKMKMAEKNFNLPLHRDTTNLVTARPTLDTILAMKYFTGLRNVSFTGQQYLNLSPVSNANGWEAQLHQLTSEAIAPIIEKFQILDTDRRLVPVQRPGSCNSMKRMYSSSGRLLTPRHDVRTSTCSSKRPLTMQGALQQCDNYQVPPELDTQVFYLLGGILQNPDPEIIKTWLLTSTERERNLMVAILRSALIDKDELNVFVAEASKEKQSRIVYTPAKIIRPTLPTIHENESAGQCDILSVSEKPVNNEVRPSSRPASRPPTSSTFRTNKTSISRPNTRSSDEWIPSESFVIK